MFSLVKNLSLNLGLWFWRYSDEMNNLESHNMLERWTPISLSLQFYSSKLSIGYASVLESIQTRKMKFSGWFNQNDNKE